MQVTIPQINFQAPQTQAPSSNAQSAGEGTNFSQMMAKVQTVPTEEILGMFTGETEVVVENLLTDEDGLMSDIMSLFINPAFVDMQKPMATTGETGLLAVEQTVQTVVGTQPIMTENSNASQSQNGQTGEFLMNSNSQSDSDSTIILPLTTQLNYDLSASAVPTASEILSPEYVSEINQTIAENVMLGKESFEIQLQPENLGTLTIKASMEAGKAVVTILCSDLDTLQTLSRNSGDIASILENRSGTETQVILETPPKDFMQQERQNDEQGNRQAQSENQNNGKDFADSTDFLQQLRLGLTQM